MQTVFKNLLKKSGAFQIIAGVYPDYAIDAAKVLVSAGLLSCAANGRATAVNGNLVFSWSDNSAEGSAKPTDKALIAVVNLVKGDAVTVSVEAERKDGTQTVILPSDWLGDEVHSYLGFVSKDGKNVANSVYLNSVTVV